MPLIPRGRHQEDAQIVHPLANPVWVERTRWVVGFLVRAREWSALVARARQEGVQEAMLRQLVAALEELGEAEAVRHGRRVLWRLRVRREREWAVPLPDEEEEKKDVTTFPDPT